jgi:hypothetical protein
MAPAALLGDDVEDAALAAVLLEGRIAEPIVEFRDVLEKLRIL